MAYLCDLYPAVSHTFVQREVRALRARGAEVVTISIRRSTPEHLRAAADHEEFTRTHALLPVSPARLLATHLRAFARGPAHYLATLAYALRLGLSSSRGPLWHLFYFAEAILAWSICAGQGIRHVHAHFTSPPADVAMLTAHFGVGLDPRWSWSFSAHGTDMQGSSERILAEKVDRATFVVCVSDYGRSQLMAITDPRAWSRIHRVRTGVDPTVFGPVTRDGAAARPVRILNVGRLHPVKGQIVLLEAVAQLRREGLELELVLVGEGPTRGTLEKAVAGLDLGGSVELTGSVGQDDIRRYYAEADIFCLPSFGEGLPVVLMEAMSTALPVVASRIAGIPELVADNVEGILVTPARPDELATALRSLVVDPELRRVLGDAGRTKVRRKFDAREAVDELALLMATTCRE